MAALMPPAAATECERTGWTLLMMATVAPASAAARAARWPARPAPMIRTSCAGMALSERRAWASDCSTEGACADPRLQRSTRGWSGQRAPDLVDGHDAREAPLAVDDHHRAALPQPLRAQQV